MGRIVLMKAMGYSVGDLDANRDGYITKEQRHQLYRRRIEQSLVVGILAFVGFSLLVGAISEIIRGNFTATVLVNTLVFGVITIIFTALVVNNWQRIAADLHKGEVDVVGGKVSLGRVLSRGVTYKLRIRDMDFEISKPVFDAMSDGKTYRVYYLPNSRIVLSIE